MEKREFKYGLTGDSIIASSIVSLKKKKLEKINGLPEVRSNLLSRPFKGNLHSLAARTG